MTRRPFLTAEWRNLAMLNFAIDPAQLTPWVPAGTEIDLFEGAALVSVVGFSFERTKVCGLAIPGHRFFPEVNLRLYVRRAVAGQVRRGVVFVKEIVPRRLVTAVARTVYGENYVTLPMRHSVRFANAGNPCTSGTVEYGWCAAGRWQRMGVSFEQPPAVPRPGSLEEFIVEHYWGYGQSPPGETLEYEVTHAPWSVSPAPKIVWECEPLPLYGPAFAEALAGRPHSALFACGSPIAVYRANKVAGSSPNSRVA